MNRISANRQTNPAETAPKNQPDPRSPPKWRVFCTRLHPSAPVCARLRRLLPSAPVYAVCTRLRRLHPSTPSAPVYAVYAVCARLHPSAPSTPVYARLRRLHPSAPRYARNMGNSCRVKIRAMLGSYPPCR